MWALGNIAGDGASMRDYVLEKGIVKPLIDLAASQCEVGLIWLCSDAAVAANGMSLTV